MSKVTLLLLLQTQQLSVTHLLGLACMWGVGRAMQSDLTHTAISAALHTIQAL
jgi:hypothetical protein